MIRVLVLANNSLLAKAVASVLAEEIDLGEVWVSHHELGYGNPRSLMIFVDEGERADDDELQKTIELFRGEVARLLIKVAMTEPKIHLYESHQLNNPETERIVGLVRGFCRANLKKNASGNKNTGFQKKMEIIRKIPTWQPKGRQTHYLPGSISFVDGGYSLVSINQSEFFVPYHIRRNFRASVTPQTGINLFQQKNLSVNRFNVNTEVIS